LHDSTYRLASFAAADGAARAGIVVDDSILDVGPSVLAILERWQEQHPKLQQSAQAIRAGTVPPSLRPLSGVRLLAPVLYPGAVFCAGANYRDHVREMSHALNLPEEPDPHELGLKPWHFVKPSAPCTRASGARIPLPHYSSRVDWEAEIALVIGRHCHDVSESEALDYVAGLTIVNDLSARDHIQRPQLPPASPFRFDWVSHKCFDGALPTGPWICPLEDIPHDRGLDIRLWVNDELMQDSSSSNLIFSFAEQVAYLSTRLTLRPGDLIATGTPAGCGAARGRFLKPGDSVRIQVEGIGKLVNEFCA
jgi:2-keto-4-pentenoate hydratase/2-oxohepta-3-ene-1,7-dioic acid hydratase in catechol pathway